MFKAGLPAAGSLLALDISKKRIGLAGTDHERRLVSPLKTITRKRWSNDVASVRAIAVERQAVALVAGLPLDMNGNFGPAAQSAHDTAARLANELEMVLLLQDERLSTEAVRQTIAEGKLPRPKSNSHLDHYAASVILQDALKAIA